jgi:hypothetical protein
MSHGFPRRSKRNRRKEKRPQLQPKPTIAAKATPTAGLISQIARPTYAAFAEAIREQSNTEA